MKTDFSMTLDGVELTADANGVRLRVVRDPVKIDFEATWSEVMSMAYKTRSAIPRKALSSKDEEEVAADLLGGRLFASGSAEISNGD